MIEIVRVLVNAGATHASAARAAVILEDGGSVEQARAVLVLEQTPVHFDAQLLLSLVSRDRELVEVGRG